MYPQQSIFVKLLGSYSVWSPPLELEKRIRGFTDSRVRGGICIVREAIANVMNPYRLEQRNSSIFCGRVHPVRSKLLRRLMPRPTIALQNCNIGPGSVPAISGRQTKHIVDNGYKLSSIPEPGNTRNHCIMKSHSVLIKKPPANADGTRGVFIGVCSIAALRAFTSCRPYRPCRPCRRRRHPASARTFLPAFRQPWPGW